MPYGTEPGVPPPDEAIVTDWPPCGVAVLGEWAGAVKSADFLSHVASLIVIDRDGHCHVYRGCEDG